MKYPDRGAVDAKIDELFEFRKISSLMTFAEPALGADWVDLLKDLQYRIYLLDAYLEGAWELDPAERKERWQAIRDALALLGYTGRAADKLLEEIRHYERIERNCRAEKWPTRIGPRTFYTIKSCDVRLMRKLVYRASPSLSTNWSEKSWLFYDRVTEVYDDVADLEEDLETWNANRFLISLLRKGIPKTRMEYEKFIRKTAKRAMRYFSGFPADDPNLQVAALTDDICGRTLELMDNTLQHLEPSRLGRSWMLGRMK